MNSTTMNMNASEYKQYHETFMQNNHGSTHFHVLLCIMFPVQCSILATVYNKYTGVRQHMFEYFVIVLPLICVHTVLAEYIYFLNLVVALLLCFKVLQCTAGIQKKFSQNNSFLHQRIQFISSIRGLTYLITGLCILAVDFKQFPRYLAKTENYGYSLMDTGVGLFVLISGLVHKDLNQNNYKTVLKGNMKLIAILVVLGTSRLFMVKQFEYQEHVTEYGTHWNFFFTLAVCKFLSSLLLLFFNQTLILSIVIIIVHEASLYIFLEDWVFRLTPRTNIINANREGISSCLGYVSLYMFAVHLKMVLNDRSLKRSKIFFFLLFSSLILWVLSYIVHIARPTSRTLANTGYCLYVGTIFTNVVLVYYTFEVLFEKKSTKYTIPIVLQACNDNGLIYFLVTNLVTGAINISIQTLLCSSLFCFLLLNIYMIATIAFTIYLELFKLKL